MAKNGFSFNMPNGANFGYAKNLTEFKKMLKVAPKDCVKAHQIRGDFANWVEYLGYPGKAKKIRAIKSKANLVASITNALSAKAKRTKKK